MDTTSIHKKRHIKRVHPQHRGRAAGSVKGGWEDGQWIAHCQWASPSPKKRPLQSLRMGPLWATRVSYCGSSPSMREVGQVDVATSCPGPNSTPSPLPMHPRLGPLGLQNHHPTALSTLSALHLNLKAVSSIHRPKLSRTLASTIRVNPARSSRYILAASMFAGLSQFGSASMDTTDSNIFSTDCTGLQRSQLRS